MEDDILRAANIEIERLEGLLHNHPLYQRLQALRRVIQLYSQEQGADPAAVQSAGPTKKRGSRPGSQASTIRDGAAAFLRQKGARASSGEIYQALVLNGVTIVGKKPTAVVASYLSHSDMFDTARDGYGLKEWSAATAIDSERETPNSSELFGAPQGNGASPLHP